MSHGALLAAGGAVLVALGLGPVTALVAPLPALEVRRSPGELHAGSLPRASAPLEDLPGQLVRLGDPDPRSGSDADTLTWVEVHLGKLGARTPDGVAGTAVVLRLASGPTPDGPWTEHPAVQVEPEGSGWLRFELPPELAPRGPWVRLHLGAVGDPGLVPWLRPRATPLVLGGWGDQARKVGGLRTELRLPPGAPPLTGLVLPALSLGDTRARPARLRVLDDDLETLALTALPPGPARRAGWLWFPIEGLDAAAGARVAAFDVDLPPGTVLVGRENTLRPTLLFGTPDPEAHADLAFLEQGVARTDRDLLLRLGTRDGTRLGTRLIERGGPGVLAGAGLGLLGAALALAAGWRALRDGPGGTSGPGTRC